jgi:hypothetical protein
LNLDLELDPEFDPDQDMHFSRSLDADPHIMYANPKHCTNDTKIFSELYEIFSILPKMFLKKSQ